MLLSGDYEVMPSNGHPAICTICTSI